MVFLIGIAAGVRLGCKSVFSEVESVVSFQVLAASLLLFYPVFQGIFWTTAFTSLSFLFNSIRFRSEVFFSVWTVRSSWELRIHSFFRFGFAVSFRFGCLVLKAESRR